MKRTARSGGRFDEAFGVILPLRDRRPLPFVRWARAGKPISRDLLAAVVEFIIAEQFLEELPLRSRRPRLRAYEALKREMLAMADAGERGARARAARKIAGGNPGKIKAAEDRVYRPTRKRRGK